jgi:beta-N-acetylhexosaminidase
VVALLAVLAGILAGRGHEDPATTGHAGRSTPDERGPSPAERLSLPRRVGELLVMSFDGSTVPAYIDRRLRDGEGTGVILFAKNAPDLATSQAVTRRLQRAARGGALVATDQEGGDIRSLPFEPSDVSQGRLGSTDAVASAARQTAHGLRTAGVNVNLAPVADVASSVGSVVFNRAFPGGGPAVARSTTAAVRGYAAEGVGATAKHFPGLGRATANTDDTTVTVPGSRAELSQTDLVPFRAAVRAGVPLVMVSHARYPAFDGARIASQSPAVVDGLLRRQLGFRGVVVTDSLEAQAVLDQSGVAEAAERSVAAGVDLVLMTGSGSFNQVQPRLLARARRDPAFRGQVTRAADRVLALKRRLGLRAAR